MLSWSDSGKDFKGAWLLCKLGIKFLAFEAMFPALMLEIGWPEENVGLSMENTELEDLVSENIAFG